MPPSMEVWSLNHWTTKEVPANRFDIGIATDPEYIPPGPPPSGDAVYYDLEWSGETEKTFNITTHFVDSRRLSILDIVELSGQFPSEMFQVDRPTDSVIRVKAGAPFSGNIRVGVYENIKSYDIVWSGQTSYTIDVSNDFGDSRVVAVTDIVALAGFYNSEAFGVERPTAGTIRILAGTPFSGALRVSVVETIPA